MKYVLYILTGWSCALEILDTFSIFSLLILNSYCTVRIYRSGTTFLYGTNFFQLLVIFFQIPVIKYVYRYCSLVVLTVPVIFQFEYGTIPVIVSSDMRENVTIPVLVPVHLTKFTFFPAICIYRDI